MPVKKTVKKVKVLKTKTKSSKTRLSSRRAPSLRSSALSETRKSSSVAKTKSKVSRVSVAAQSNRRTAIKKASKSTSAVKLSASVYDIKGKVVGRVSLPSEIFGVEEKPELMSQAVRVYLANQRQGTVSTKTRGEVQGSTRKIYRQKGTGRARHGSNRAPIFVHGGIVFGPKPRDFSLDLPKKMKRLALFSSLSQKQRSGEIKIVGGLEKIKPKTKLMAKVIKTLKSDGKILLVVPGSFKDFNSVYLSARNIEGVKILTPFNLNTYEVLDNNSIILMKDSIEIIKKHFIKS